MKENVWDKANEVKQEVDSKDTVQTHIKMSDL